MSPRTAPVGKSTPPGTLQVGVEAPALGLFNPGQVYANLAPPALIEMALARGEGTCSERGALVAATGQHTGRLPRDRYLVAEPGVREEICWGQVNQPMEPAVCARLLTRATQELTPPLP